MKKIVYFILPSIILIACNGLEKSKEQPAKESLSTAIEVSKFVNAASGNIGKEIVVKGTVSHVCSHAGRRCFIVDSTGNHSIRIEAKGDIGSFNRELSGNDIIVTGIVQEKKLDKAFLDEWEQKVKDKHKDAEEGGDHCSADLNNIQHMRESMKNQNKDYYSIFYMDGTRYKLVHETKL